MEESTMPDKRQDNEKFSNICYKPDADFIICCFSIQCNTNWLTNCKTNTKIRKYQSIDVLGERDLWHDIVKVRSGRGFVLIKCLPCNSEYHLYVVSGLEDLCSRTTFVLAQHNCIRKNNENVIICVQRIHCFLTGFLIDFWLNSPSLRRLKIWFED